MRRDICTRLHENFLDGRVAGATDGGLHFHCFDPEKRFSGRHLLTVPYRDTADLGWYRRTNVVGVASIRRGVNRLRRLDGVIDDTNFSRLPDREISNHERLGALDLDHDLFAGLETIEEVRCRDHRRVAIPSYVVSEIGEHVGIQQV